MLKNIFSPINMKLLPMKAHYFLFNLGTTPILANITIIARQKGFSSAVVGTFLTILFIVSTITKPFYGWLADHFKIHKFIFITMEAVTGISYFLIYFIPSISNQVIVSSNIENTTILFCPKTPIWDKCIEERFENNKSSIFKCQLNCNTEAWVKDNICKNCTNYINYLKPFKSEILIDMKTVKKDTNCLTVQYLKKSSNISGVESFYSNVSLYAKTYDILCDATCEDDILKGTLANKGAIPDNEVILKYEFWLFCVLYLIGCSSNLVVNSMGDTICFDLLGEDSHLYGQQRVWDSVGSGAIAILIGIVIDVSAGDSTFKDYTIVYFLCLIIICFDIICSMKLVYKQTENSKSILKDVGKLFKSVKIFTFFCWCCFGGLFSAAIFSFVFWHLEELTDKLGQNECGTNYVKTLEGVDMFIQNFFGEIPFFFWSGFIIKKLGHVNCMHIILGAFAARFLYYSILFNPWWVLPIEILNGLTFGLLCSVMVSYANLIAPPGAEATLQGLVGALFDGMGMSLGSFAAGVLFNNLGGHYAFRIFGITATCAMIIHFLIYTFLNLFEKKKNNTDS